MMIQGIVKIKWNHGSFIFKIEGAIILLYGSVMPEGTTSGRKSMTQRTKLKTVCMLYVN